MNAINNWDYSDVFEALVAGNLPSGTDLNGRYEIGQFLGRGGVGLVYRAMDHMLGEDVVLKILNPAVASDPDAVKRFKREIKVCRKISHPNVIRIYDIDEIYGTLFITMELVEGETLRKVIRTRGRYNEKDGWEVVQGMVQGLAAAHEKGIVHRDLKSLNVMVESGGGAKILDFGMARLLGSDHLTREGDILGSPPYMSPEQAQGLDVDHRTDIYSLGIILFEMFTGQLPFLAETPLATVMLQIDRPPPKPTSLVPGLSPEIETMILTCLEKNPDDRFQSVEELLSLHPAKGETEELRLHCARCGDSNHHSFRFCKSCGNSLQPAEAKEESWFDPAEARESDLSFPGSLVCAVVASHSEQLPAQLAMALELAATLKERATIQEFQKNVSSANYPGIVLPHGEQILCLIPALRFFTNRARMREAIRGLMSGYPHGEVMMGYFVAEILSFLARQRSRKDSRPLTLRSLMPMLRNRLQKAFSSERWITRVLRRLDDPLERLPLGRQFEATYSEQPGLLALHVLFCADIPNPGDLEQLLDFLELDLDSESRWRQTTAILAAAWWGFWHGIEAIPEHLVRDRRSAPLAYDLGVSIGSS